MMITHEPEIAAHAKRVLHIRDGMLLEAQASGTTPAGAAPVTGETPAPSVPLPPDVIPVQEFHIAPKKRPAAPQAAQPAGEKKPAAAPAAPVREASLWSASPASPPFWWTAPSPCGRICAPPSPRPKPPLCRAAADHGPARGGAQARSPAKTCPRPPACQAPRRGGGAQAAQPGRLCHTYPHRFGGLLPTAQARPLCRAEALGAPHGVLSAGA